MDRVFAGVKAVRGVLVVIETALNVVLGVFDTITDVGQALAKPEHKTLFDRNVEAKVYP